MQDKSDWIFLLKNARFFFHFRQNRQILEGGEAAVVPKTKPNDAMFSIRGRHPGDGYAPVLRFAQNAFAR